MPVYKIAWHIKCLAGFPYALMFQCQHYDYDIHCGEVVTLNFSVYLHNDLVVVVFFLIIELF